MDWKRSSKRHKAATFDFLGIPHDIKPQARRQLVGHPDLEKHVIRAVGELLAVHPRCFLAVRQNSGGASYEQASGKYAPIFFYKLLRPHDAMTITDFWGIVKTPRFDLYLPFAIECKRPSWNGISSDREMRQEKFIALICESGGVGGFVRNVEEANAILG